MNVFFFG